VSEELYRAAGSGRLGTAAAFISAVGCLPYLSLVLLEFGEFPMIRLVLNRINARAERLAGSDVRT
jgi:hypothetical protein